MRATFSLLWKEYREQRWFLLAALVIFCGFPLIEATGRYLRPPTATTPGFPAPEPEFYSDSALGLVLGLGGVLAIFVGVGCTTRDLRDELHVFWRSRPVGVGAWMGVKFLAGAFTVLAACTIPLLMQLAMMTLAADWRQYDATTIAGTVGVYSFTLLLIFSVAFCLGCLIRHTTHAALLAMAAMLLIFFLPVLVRPLAPLSVFNVMNDNTVRVGQGGVPVASAWSFRLSLGTSVWQVLVQKREWTTFAAAMLGGSIAAGALALLAVQRDWRVAADRQAMHWSLGGVALVLFGATAFQLGSNLKVLRQFDLPIANHSVVGMGFDGSRGVALLRDTTSQQYYGQVQLKLCAFETTSDGAVTCGPVLSPSDKLNVPYLWNGKILFWRPQRPDRAHLLVEHSGWLAQPVKGRNYEVTHLQLITLDVTGRRADPVIHRLDLVPHLPDMQTSARGYQTGDRVYVSGRDHVVEIDLADGDAPRVVGPIDVSVPGPGAGGRISSLWMYSGQSQMLPSGKPGVQVPLVAIGGLSPRERLEATLALALYNARQTLHGDLLVAAGDDGLTTYRLTALDEQAAVFEQVGRREQTPMERLFGSYAVGLTVIDGRVYAQESRIGTGMSVYDIADPAKPASTGHFALPKATAMNVGRLPTGELLLAGDRFYVLAPPPRP